MVFGKTPVIAPEPPPRPNPNVPPPRTMNLDSCKRDTSQDSWY